MKIKYCMERIGVGGAGEKKSLQIFAVAVGDVEISTDHFLAIYYALLRA
jgi:hypothetical protein